MIPANPQNPAEWLADHATPIHGCLGEALGACIREVGIYGNVNIISLPERAIDINRNPIIKSDQATLDVGHNIFGDLKLTFDLSETDTIIKVYADLPGGYTSAAFPNSLKTLADYKQSAMYQVAFLTLGIQCPTLDERDFYKFFENQVKRKIASRHSSSVRWAGADDTIISEADGLSYCGKKFEYISEVGYDTDSITSYNPKGLKASSRILFY